MELSMSFVKVELTQVSSDVGAMSTLKVNRENINKFPGLIKKVDSDVKNNLDLFCYLLCNKEDPEFIKRTRGIVFNDDKVILQSFPYTMEYTEDNDAELRSVLEPIFKDCLFYKSYEGCLIRVFYFNNRWYICTNKKLDAYKSKWSSSESYGSFFEKAIYNQLICGERFSDTVFLGDESTAVDFFCENFLSKDKQYMFLLLNSSDNRIVCDEPEKATVYHVGTFIDGVLTMDEDIRIPYPEKLEFKSIEDIYEYVDKVDYTQSQGVIVFAPGNLQYKILNVPYFDYYGVRGNEASIKFRYLQVRMDKKLNSMLRELYPNNVKDFEEYENHIFNASQVIYNAYVDRFKKKLYVKVPVEEFNVVREAHNWYLQDRDNNKINYDKIIEILNRQTPTNLNKIIKRLKLGKKIKNTDQPRLMPIVVENSA